MRGKILGVLLGVLLVTFLIVPSSIAQTSLPRNETVYTLGALWSATTWSLYNPSSTYGTEQFMYMPLFLYSNMKDGWLPIIGESFQAVNKRTLRVKIRKEAAWSDGTPLTADDVAFTFALTKEVGIGPGNGWWDYIQSVRAVDSKTVEFIMRPDAVNYASFLGYALNTRIVPKHVYEPFEKKGVQAVKDFLNDDPAKQVVSGPYKLYYADPNIVAYGRIDNWWGKSIFGLPVPKYIGNIIYKDNSVANLDFEKGNADWGGVFIPDIAALWKDKKLPVKTWFDNKPYFMPDGLDLLYISYYNPLLRDPAVRKAIAYSIPYQEMLDKAYFGYGNQAHPSMVIDDFEAYHQYIDSAYAKYFWGSPDGKVKTDLKKANDILDKAGYKKGRDGIRVSPDGKRMGTFTIQVPSGWTDWMMMCEMMAANMKAIGLDVKTEFPDYSVWWTRWTQGTFDFILGWSAGPGYDHPWNVYRVVLDPALYKPFGQDQYGNFERYNNPEVGKIIDKLAATLDPKVRKTLYYQLQRIVYRDLPAIPLFYGAHWYEVNETYWVGFPTAKDPWWFPSSPWHAMALPTLFGIAPKGQTPKVPAWVNPVSKGGLLVPTDDILSALSKAK
ncbi:MAG TPA: ABC transporter substrate-binding protein [Dictyoglomaceae bacterium]|nr:ABC transporter substrate-binding protein [Dictyoglomaceae bacterium]